MEGNLLLHGQQYTRPGEQDLAKPPAATGHTLVRVGTLLIMLGGTGPDSCAIYMPYLYNLGIAQFSFHVSSRLNSSLGLGLCRSKKVESGQ